MSRPVSLLSAALICAGAMAGSPAHAEDGVTEKLAHGEVNWTDKTVLATGSGAPDLKLPNVAAVRLNAERAAQIAAFRNVLEAIKGVRITATTLGAEQLGKEQIKMQVEGIIKGCRTIDTRYFSDLGVDVVVKCPIDGSLAAVIAPPKEFKEIQTGADKTFTGLIVDASALHPRPAIAPRLVADGTDLYAQEMVKPNFLRKHGSIAYFRTVDQAKKSDRIGTNPLVVKATRLADGDSDLVLAAEDAAKVKAAWYLVEGRVVIATEAQ
jgi:hypothetical protein